MAAERETSSKRTRIIFLSFLAIALFFLLTEHRAHVFGFLPYLLVLACPLMHFFHHKGHGGHHGSHQGREGDKQKSPYSNPTQQPGKGRS